MTLFVIFLVAAAGSVAGNVAVWLILQHTHPHHGRPTRPKENTWQSPP